MKKVIIILLTILVASCSKEWLDVNTDPNSPSAKNVTTNLLLPAAELSIASVINTDYNIAGGMWVQYWTQSTGSTQYASYDSYNITSSTLDYDFQTLYMNGLNNLETIKIKSLQEQDSRQFLIATALQCYTFQMLVDLYDQIPFSEAFKGDKNLQPHFEKGQNVYDSLIVRLNYAASLLNTALKNPALAKQFAIAEPADLIFNGDVSSWLKFVNTLKLKIFLREAYALPTIALDSINYLLSQPQGFLITDAAITQFINSASKDNPLYEYDQRNTNYTGNIKASNTFITWLKLLPSDARMNKLFQLTAINNQIAGMPQGSYNEQTSIINPATVSTAKIQPTDPAYIFCLAEVYLLQAEAYLRTGQVVTAQKYYNAGVSASFSRLGYSSANYIGNQKYAFPNTGFDDELKSIIVQKWAALANINGMEAYIEFLRTKYPSRNNPVFDYPNLVNPLYSFMQAGLYPLRLLFPLSERTTNPNTPPEVPVTTPVWWNVNN